MKVLLLLFPITCVLSIDLTTWELFDQNTELLTIKDQIMWKLASNDFSLPGGGYGVFYWDEGTQQWVANGGSCLMLALSVDQLYCCNTGSIMFRKDNQVNSDPWKVSETCSYVKIGSNNHVWFTTNTPATGGYTIKTYDITTLTSTLVAGGATKVAPTPDGKAWIVTDTGEIKQWDGTSWNSRPGSAMDIIVGNDGIPFIVSTISRNGAYEIMKWNDTQGQWETLEGIEGISLALDSRNNPYIIAGNNSVYRPKIGVLLDFCHICHINCSTCSDEETCNKCYETTCFLDNTCMRCNNETYASRTIGSCINPCLNCKNETYCLNCQNGYYLHSNGVCELCPENQYLLSNGSCSMCPESLFLRSNGSCSICQESLFYYSDGSCQKCQESYFLYPNDTCISTCVSPYIEDYTSSPLKKCKPFQSIAEIIINVTQSTAMAVTQVATALTSKSPGGVMVGIAGRIFFIIKFLNITRSTELEHALQTWKSNFVPIDFNFLMPSAMEENIPERPVPRIFEKRQVPASFLLNSWDNLIFILIIVFISTLLQIVMLCIKKEKWLRIIKRTKVAVQNYLITQLYAIYGDLIFYIILELRVIYLGNWTINLSFTIELIFLLFIITSFTLHFLLLVKYQKVKKEAQNTNNKELLQQFQKHHEGVELLFIDFKDDSLLHHAFLIFITSRDMLFSLVITTLFGLTLAQVMIFLLLNINLLVYLILKRPFKERFEEIQQFTFEVIILTVSIIEITGAILDNIDSFGSNIQIILGKLLIILNISFNICALLFMIFKIVFWIKSAYHDFKQRKIVKRRTVTRIIRKHKQRTENPIHSSQVNDVSIIKTLKSRNDDISIQNLEL